MHFQTLGLHDAPLVHIKEVQPALPACSACVKGERCASLHSGKRAVSFTRSGCPGGGIAVQAPAFPHGRCTYIRCPILQSLTDPLNNVLRHANTRAGGVEAGGIVSHKIWHGLAAGRASGPGARTQPRCGRMLAPALGLLLRHQACLAGRQALLAHIRGHVAAQLHRAPLLARKVLPQHLARVDEPEVLRAAHPAERPARTQAARAVPQGARRLHQQGATAGRAPCSRAGRRAVRRAPAGDRLQARAGQQPQGRRQERAEPPVGQQQRRVAPGQPRKVPVVRARERPDAQRLDRQRIVLGGVRHQVHLRGAGLVSGAGRAGGAVCGRGRARAWPRSARRLWSGRCHNTASFTRRRWLASYAGRSR